MAFPVNVDSTWVNPDAVTLDAGELRRADAAAFAGAGGTVFGGVTRHQDTSLAVTVDGSDVVTVQPGSVVIPGNAVAGTGPYRASLSASATGTLTARHATNSRIDLVVFRQLDTDVVGSHGAFTARVEIIAGTPSATPAVPSLPSMAVELGRLTVPPTGGSAATVDSTFRTYSCAVGGTLPVPSFSRLPASASTGQRAVALDTLLFYLWNGTAWTGVDARVKGRALSVTPSSGVVVVTHGLGVSPSCVQVTPSALLAPGMWAPTVTARTTTTFTMAPRYYNNTTPGIGITFDWVAEV